jgi:hypothetical protein
VGVARRDAERTVREHLGPVHGAVLEEAHTIAVALTGKGYSILEPERISDSSDAKVRKSAERFRSLAGQFRVVSTAAGRLTGVVAGAGPADDTNGDFGTFKHPEKLAPGWSPVGTAPWPRYALPSEPVVLLWTLVTSAWEGQPWLPVPTEQDARWVEVFGEQRARRRKASDDARSVAGR